MVPLKSQRVINRMLCLFSTCLLGATIVTSGAVGVELPVWVHQRQLHVLLGLIAAVVVVLAHTLAFFYLIETAINIKRAVAQRGIDEAWIDRHAPLKKRVWPIAFWSMVLIAAAAIFGGGLDSGMAPRWIHQLLAYSAVAVTLVAWVIEDRAFGECRALIEAVNAEIAEKAAPPADLPPDEETPPDITDVGPEETLWMLGRWLAFLGPSLWLWFAYKHLVMFSSTYPWWIYLIVSVVMTGAGVFLEQRFRYLGQPDDEAPADE